MTKPATDPSHVPATPSRSGSFFILASGIFLITFVVFLLVVSPRLADQLGLNEGVRVFPTPPATVEFPLELDGTQIGVAVWDSEGVCAELTDRGGSTYRTCAEPDPLKPIWAIDAPDEADPAYVLIAGPPLATEMRVRTTDGQTIAGATQGGTDVPAGWAVIPLPDDAVVAEIVAVNAESSDLGNALCGDEDAPTDGPNRLQGGCFVPRQD